MHFTYSFFLSPLCSPTVTSRCNSTRFRLPQTRSSPQVVAPSWRMVFPTASPPPPPQPETKQGRRFLPLLLHRLIVYLFSLFFYFLPPSPPCWNVIAILALSRSLPLQFSLPLSSSQACLILPPCCLPTLFVPLFKRFPASAGTVP